HARNLAIERARGAYILPLDADDYLAPAFLEKTVPLLDDDPELGVAYTWVGLVGGHHGIWRTGGFTVRELLVRCTLHVASLYRRELWRDVGGYDPRFVESSEAGGLGRGAAARGWRGRCVPELLVYYRRSATSRERHARQPAISARLMRALVEKHRTLYEANLEDALAGMYQERAEVCLPLEPTSALPPARPHLRPPPPRRAARPRRPRRPSWSPKFPRPPPREAKNPAERRARTSARGKTSAAAAAAPGRVSAVAGASRRARSASPTAA